MIKMLIKDQLGLEKVAMTGCATGRSRDRSPDRNRSRSCQSRQILDGNRTGSCQSHPPGVKSPVVTGPQNTTHEASLCWVFPLIGARHLRVCQGGDILSQSKAKATITTVQTKERY